MLVPFDLQTTPLSCLAESAKASVSVQWSMDLFRMGSSQLPPQHPECVCVCVGMCACMHICLQLQAGIRGLRGIE